MTFDGPMAPWPGLAQYGRRVRLADGGISLFLYEAGPADGPGLLLLHGLGDEADTWRHVLPPLAQHYHVLAPDLPGAGRSDKPDVAFTLPFLRETMVALLDAVGMEAATVVGHSLGAVVAQALALSAPDRVRNLVLVSGGLVVEKQPLNLQTLLFLVPGIGEWLYKRLRRNPDKAYATLAPYYASLRSLPREERLFLYQRVNERVWSETQRRAYFSTLRGVMPWVARRQRMLRQDVRGVTTPTEIVWGEADRIIPAENGRVLASLLPAARFTLVPGGGHQLPQEQPEAIVEAVTARTDAEADRTAE